MAFPLTFNVINRDTDERQIDNILERHPGDYKQNSIAVLAAKVDTGNNTDFISAKERLTGEYPFSYKYLLNQLATVVLPTRALPPIITTIIKIPP